MVELLIMAVFGLISGFFGSMISGGVSVFSLALLGMYGLSPLTALGVLRVGSIGFQIGGFANYARAHKVVWKYTIPFTLVGLVGAYFGGVFVLSIHEDILGKIIGFALILFVPLSLMMPTFGLKHLHTGKQKKWFGYVLYTLMSAWGGSFMIGTGAMSLLVSSYSFGMTILEAKGTARIPGLTKGLLVLYLFAQAGAVDWPLGIAFVIGMYIGAFYGARFAIRIGNLWLRRALLIAVIFISYKMITGF